MNLHRRPQIIAAGGFLCFCLGAWLRFQAASAATSMLQSGLQFENMGPTIATAARAGAIYDVATPLLWVGGTLVVLAAAIWLLPVWRAHFDEV